MFSDHNYTFHSIYVAILLLKSGKECIQLYCVRIEFLQKLSNKLHYFTCLNINKRLQRHGELSNRIKIIIYKLRVKF